MDGQPTQYAPPKQSSLVAHFAKHAKKSQAKLEPPKTDEPLLKLEPSPKSDDPLWGGQEEEPAPPSLEVARARLAARLPRDPTTGTHVSGGRSGPRLADFEFLGLGVYSYIAHLHRTRTFFMLLALLSVSSLVANGYGGQLATRQANLVTWLFTGASLGNASSVAPAYGATELLLSSLLTAFLFWSVGALREDAHRVEQKLVTPADFAVLVSGTPPASSNRRGPAASISTCSARAAPDLDMIGT